MRALNAGTATVTPGSPVRVMIVGDSRLFCEGLRRLLAADRGLAVVGEPTLGALGGTSRGTAADILLIDARLREALAVCRDLRRDGARPWTILVAADADDDWVVEALQAGARGILPKTATAESLLKAVHVVHAGQIWASKTVLARIVDRIAERSVRTQAAEVDVVRRLSPREQEVVQQTATGLSNQEVAGRLSISEATVKAHLTHVFRKLGVRDRAQLVAFYHRTGGGVLGAAGG